MRALNERRPFVKRRSHTFVRLRVVSRTAALHCSPAKSRMSANGPVSACLLSALNSVIRGVCRKARKPSFVYDRKDSRFAPKVCRSDRL